MDFRISLGLVLILVNPGLSLLWSIKYPMEIQTGLPSE